MAPRTLSALFLAFTFPVFAQEAGPIPDDFPRCRVPGLEKELDLLRDLHWRHWAPGGRAHGGMEATFTDDYLPGPKLWPSVATGGMSDAVRAAYDRSLSNRILDAEGYVATHQHGSVAHPLGWPFPAWMHGRGGRGWHFSRTPLIGTPDVPDYRGPAACDSKGWTLEGAGDDGIDPADGWKLKLAAPDAVLLPPAEPIDSFNAPFLVLRWRATGLGQARPFVEWTTAEATAFGPDRRMEIPAVPGEAMADALVPMYRHPKWTGEIARLRIGLGNPAPGGSVVVRALFTAYDTRHNVNNANFIRGADRFFRWTGDVDFLRRNVNRMRLALRYPQTEFHALEKSAIWTTWVGHDGRPGFTRNPDGSKTIHSGHGVGNDYWDIMPFGGLDAFATIRYYDAARRMAALEGEILAHPEWSVPGGPLAFDPAALDRHADAVKAEFNRLFWNAETGRFVGCIDADGNAHDYGFTFLNFDAVHFDVASPEHAESILKWIGGERTVEGDTAQGADIYHWRFAPRATTRRNLDWYFWAWSNPEGIPWGGQVQDGGAVLGWSYHDLMARLKVWGPDDAWARLKEILAWYDEVKAAGGYRAYYNGSREGTMQGAGTAGGLGLDMEFVESLLVPSVLLDGFLGFEPTADGFRIDPKLPKDWPELSIDRIRLHGLTLAVRATPRVIEVTKQDGRADAPFRAVLPPGRWRIVPLRADGAAPPGDLPPVDGAAGSSLDWTGNAGFRFDKQD